MNNEKDEKMIELAELFVAITGIIYVTGFLVAMAFADYLGAREAISEFFRAKYLQDGILCVSLPVIIIGCVYAVVELKSSMPVGRKLYGSSVILIFNLPFTCYTFLLFSPAHFLKDKPYLVWAIFGVTIGGIVAIQQVVKIIVPEHQAKFQFIGRWIVCAVTLLGLDIYCFYGMADRLVEIFCIHGRVFLLFIATMACFVGLLTHRLQFYKEPRAKRAVLVMAACIFGPLYFLTVLTFAYTIYPNIPANRGGGDFTEAPLVVVYYDRTHTNEIPAEVNQGGISKPLVLIEESEKWLLVADPEDGGGRTAWRGGNGKPHIYSINRDSVISFVYQSRQLPQSPPPQKSSP